jgi:hypothetical protein
MAARVGFAPVAIAGIGAAALGCGLLSAGPAGAQTCTPAEAGQSCVTFNTIPTTWSQLSGSGLNALANGTFKYDAGALDAPSLSPPSSLGLSGDYFLGVGGLEFISSPLNGLDGQDFEYASTSGVGQRLATFQVAGFQFLPSAGSSCAICGQTFFPILGFQSGGNRIIDNLSGSNSREIIANGGPFTFQALTPVQQPDGTTMNMPSGIDIVLNFNASAIVADNAPNGAGFGDISFQTISSDKVPAPLPLLGAGSAFAFSRRLRKRVAAASASSS